MAQVLPDALRVEVGYGSTPLTALSAVTWTDVTSSVRLSDGVSFSRGRFGNDTSARPGSCSFTLDNSAQKGTAGRFTSGASEVLLRLPVRVRAVPPTNLVPNTGFETNTSSWFTNGAGTTLARTTSDAFAGSASGLVTRSASSGSGIYTSTMTVSASTAYTGAAYLKSPSGSGTFNVTVNLNWYNGAAFLSSSTGTTVTLTAGADWQRVTVTGTAPGTANGCVMTVYTAAAGTAGHTFLVDGATFQLGSSASPLEAFFAASAQDLWYGYVESVQAGWEDGFRPVVRVSATDRLARLEKRRLPSLIRGVQSALGAVAMWPLDDDFGSAFAGEQSTATDVGNLRIRQLGTGGTLEFGATGSPGPDDVQCAVLTPATATGGLFLDGKYLRAGSLGAAWAAATAISAEVFFYYTGGGVSGIMDLDGSLDASVWVDSTNKINLGWYTTIAGPTVEVDRWHHIVVTQSTSGTTTTTKAYFDGVEFASDPLTAGSAPPVSNAGLSVGTGLAYLWNGRLSHVALYASALSASQVAANAKLRDTLADYSAEAASAAFNRVCQISGLPSSEYAVSGTTAATVAPIPVADQSLLDAANEVAVAEQGVVHLSRAGVLTLAARGVRYNPASKFSLPAKTVSRGTAFSTDMSYMVNDVTVTRPGGITTRSTDATSVAAYDTHDQTLTAYVATDNQAAELASRLSRVNATPAPRVSDIQVDLVAAAADLDEAAVLIADVGDYFQVTSLPTGSPESTLHLFVEGVSHQVGESSWQVTMTTTPASEDFYRGVWVLGDASYSQLGSTTVLAF